MTHEAFDALVRRIEDRSQGHSLRLRLSVAGWLLLGYAGFLFWFLLILPLGLVAMLAAAVMPHAGALLFAVFGGIMLTLGVAQLAWLASLRPEPTVGRILRRGEAPEFDLLLETLRAEMHGPAFHRVRLTIDFNACIRQVPRLGVFGWSWNELHVGLPLLEGLSREEFRAVLAHELAHLVDRAGRYGHSMYRLRLTWEALFTWLFDSHRPPTWHSAVVTRFLTWYWPRFNARALVLSRQFELMADSRSAQVVGADIAGSALWRIECLTRLLGERFWPAVWRLPNTDPAPPADILSRLRISLRTPPEPAEAETWMDQACRTVTDAGDTHPCLARRLENLDQSVASYRSTGFAGPATQSAGKQLLGPAQAALQRDVEVAWVESVTRVWRDRHARAALVQQRMRRLDEVADAGRQPSVLWEKACDLLDLHGPAQAEPLLRDLLEIAPRHSAARYVLGRHLLESGQSEGEALLWSVARNHDDEFLPQACEALLSHFRSTGQTDQMQAVRRQLDRHATALAVSQQERSTVSASDRFLPHALSAEQLQTAQHQLSALPGMGRAWLARKHLEHFPQQPLFVLCVEAQRTGWFRSAARDQACAASLVNRVSLPGRVVVIAPWGGFRSLGKTLMKPHFQIWPESELANEISPDIDSR